MEFTNDKEFYIYVESLVRFYLGQEPILRNLETRSLSQREVTDEVFADVGQWVIKGVLESAEKRCGSENFYRRRTSRNYAGK